MLLTDEEIASIRWATPVQSMATAQDFVMLTKDEMTVFARAIESAVLAKLREEKPTIYRWTLRRDGFVQYTHLPNNPAEFPEWDVMPLFEHPAPIPEGMVLVPVEPTMPMLIALNEIAIVVAGLGHEDGPQRVLTNGYKEMLAAARSGE